MIKKFISYLNWLWKGKPVIKYRRGFNCGYCREWIYKDYTVPTYKSGDKWWDNWDLCDNCTKNIEELKEDYYDQIENY